MSNGFRFPDATRRTFITGSTGSGKSQFATWLLSTRNIKDRPWVIIDPKRDPLIAELPAEELPLGCKPPREPGLYVIHPIPELHDAWIEQFLWQCWQQEDIGLYIDEGYMIPRTSKAMKALLTQGRSKHIEMIMLSQRPAWCHPMMISESDFIVIFRLNLPEDRERMSKATTMNIEKGLPEFHSRWYDVGRDRGFMLKPAPDSDEIIDAFERFKKRTVKVL